MKPYRWSLGGQAYPEADPIVVRRGESIRFVFRNPTGMDHPFHLHGHSFYVLGKPGGSPRQTDKLAVYFASKCDAYGEPRPPEPHEKRLTVAMPIIDHRQPAADPNLRSMCRSCASCKKFVAEETVASDLGWTSGLCSAKGKLILSNQQVYEARDCNYREFGTVMRSTAGIALLPEYEDCLLYTSDAAGD